MGSVVDSQEAWLMQVPQPVLVVVLLGTAVFPTAARGEVKVE
jgi:hypothetical protein